MCSSDLSFQAVWLAPGTLAEKIAYLTGTGAAPTPATQPTLVKNVTVLDDGLVDAVYGADSLDWVV